MIQTGLVSITFRQLSPPAIIDLVRQAGLEGIEWGGDVHVPHGDLGRDHFASIEYVAGDAPEAFLRDAQVLRAWCCLSDHNPDLDQ
jgi:hypothetical protein